MNFYRDVLTMCSRCGKTSDRYFNPTEHNDERSLPDGAICLCMYCGRWSIFEDSAMRAPSAREEARIATTPECIGALQGWFSMMVNRRTAKEISND